MKIALPLLALFASVSPGSLAGASSRELVVAHEEIAHRPRPIERVSAERVELRRIVAARIAGVWGLDAPATRRLRPGKLALLEPKLSFAPDDRVGLLVTTATPRLAGLDVFGSGVFRIGSAWRLYVLIDDGEAMRLLVFDPSEKDFYLHPASLAIGLSGKGAADEHLYLGVGRRAESAYARAASFAGA